MRFPRLAPREPAVEGNVSHRDLERRRRPFGAIIVGIVGLIDLFATLLALAAS